MKTRFISVLASVICFVSLVGCTPAGVISVNGNEIVSKDPTGKTTVRTGKTSYPTNLPVSQYPGSDVFMSQVTAADDHTGGNKLGAMLNSKDPVDKIIQFYKTELVSKGWKIENEQSSPAENGGMANIYAKNGDKQINVSVIGGSSDGGATISIGVP